MKRADTKDSKSPLTTVNIEDTEETKEEVKPLNPLHAVFLNDRIFVGYLNDEHTLSETVLIHHDGADIYQENETDPEYTYSYYGDFIGTLQVNQAISTVAELDSASILCATYYNTFTDPE